MRARCCPPQSQPGPPKWHSPQVAAITRLSGTTCATTAPPSWIPRRREMSAWAGKNKGQAKAFGGGEPERGRIARTARSPIQREVSMPALPPERPGCPKAPGGRRPLPDPAAIQLFRFRVGPALRRGRSCRGNGRREVTGLAAARRGTGWPGRGGGRPAAPPARDETRDAPRPPAAAHGVARDADEVAGCPRGAAWLGEPFRPGAGRDPGGGPAAAPDRALDDRRGPPPHPAPRPAARVGAAAQGPPGAHLAACPGRDGDDRDRGVRARSRRWPSGGNAPGRLRLERVCTAGGRAAATARWRLPARRVLHAAGGRQNPRRYRDVATCGHSTAHPPPPPPPPLPPPGRAGARQPLAVRGSPWQSLYLRPEPQGHGELRPTFANLSPPADSVRRSTWPPPSALGAL